MRQFVNALAFFYWSSKLQLQKLRWYMGLGGRGRKDTDSNMVPNRTCRFSGARSHCPLLTNPGCF